MKSTHTSLVPLLALVLLLFCSTSKTEPSKRVTRNYVKAQQDQGEFNGEREDSLFLFTITIHFLYDLVYGHLWLLRSVNVVVVVVVSLSEGYEESEDALNASDMNE